MRTAAWLTGNAWPAIVSVADRAPPVFASTVSSTVPLPLPLPLPLVKVIHDGSPVVDQPQPLAVETATDVGPPPAGAAWLVGFNVYVQLGAAAAWLTVNARPATVSVAVRAAPVFACTVRFTVPFPLPLPLPLVKVIHDGSPVVDQLQPLDVATATEVVPPEAAMLRFVGVMV